MVMPLAKNARSGYPADISNVSLCLVRCYSFAVIVTVAWIL